FFEAPDVIQWRGGMSEQRAYESPEQIVHVIRAKPVHPGLPIVGMLELRDLGPGKRLASSVRGENVLRVRRVLEQPEIRIGDFLEETAVLTPHKNIFVAIQDPLNERGSASAAAQNEDRRLHDLTAPCHCGMGSPAALTGSFCSAGALAIAEEWI